MSLKAKLEAVIYAAEEPVTLAQLAVLFAGEALEWKAARDAEQAPALPLPEEAAAEAAAESLASAMEPAALPELVADPASAEPSQAESPEAAESATERAAVASAEAEDSEAEPSAEQSNTAEQPAPAVESAAAGVDAEAADSVSEDAETLAEVRIETTSIAPLEAPPADSELETEAAAGVEPTPDRKSDPNSELVAAVSAEEAELEARRQERRREREAREVLRSILDDLIAEYAADNRGIEIREIAGGYRMGTKPEMHDAVRAFVKSLKPPLKLSLPALETLAVIAYKQPVTAPEVGEIRGVDSAGVLGSLMSRKLVATAGRKQVVGRPMLYKTTKEFLLRFGLKDLNELPSMEEFEKMAAQELSEDAVDEATAQTGDLFAESETATVPGGNDHGDETADETAAMSSTAPAQEESEATAAEAIESAPETATESAASHPEEQGEAHLQGAESNTHKHEATGETPDAEEIEVQS